MERMTMRPEKFPRLMRSIMKPAVDVRKAKTIHARALCNVSSHTDAEAPVVSVRISY